MDRVGRWTIAITIFLMTFGMSMVVAGASTDGPPEDSPALFQTVPSAPGDLGLYKTALVVVSGGEGEYHDMNAQYAFERLPDRLMLVDGDLEPVVSYIGEWQTDPYEFDLDGTLELPQFDIPRTPQLNLPDCWPDPPKDWNDDEQREAYEDAWDDCEDEWDDATDEYEDEWDDWEDEYEDRLEAYQASLGAWESALGQDTHIVRASDWHVTHHQANTTAATTFREGAEVISDIRIESTGPLGLGGRSSIPVATNQRLTFTEPLAVPGPCGWRTSLQDGPQDMWQPILVHGECPADMYLGFADVDHITGPIEMMVSGKDIVNGEPAVVFSTAQDPDRLRLWFTPDTPYPVRVLTRTTSVPEPIQEQLGSGYRAPQFYVLHELVAYKAGLPEPGPEALAGPSIEGARGQWGPTLGEFDHPWPLPIAAAEALDHPTACSGLEDFMAGHPDARAVSASYTIVEAEDPDHSDPIVDEAWHVVVSDGTGFEFIIDRHTETQAEAGDVPVLGTPDPVRVPEISCSIEQAIDASPPAEDSSAAVGQAALLQSLWTGAQATGYGFTSENGTNLVTVGVTPVSPGDATLVDLLTITDRGELRRHTATDAGYPEPAFNDDGWNPSADGAWRYQTAASGIWRMPEPATAATLFGLSAAAGGLALLGPALKALLGGLPMFSRIRKEDLLDHPVRGDIMEAIRSDPGIHFQEIVRRTGKGRGTMEHHIRKMVAAGLLVEKADKGFTCYFPKGEIDRNLMAVAPLLKADGARNIMQAVIGQPGTVTTDIAQVLGMATSTVNYHVKKLVEAGLVEQSRHGRYMQLRTTALGEQALAQFGRT